MAERGSYERSSTEIPTSPVAAVGYSREASLGDREPTKPAAEELFSSYDNVTKSEIGVNTLLGRLKQSIASARDFALFLRKRSLLEEEHAQALKKLCRSTVESIRRPDGRQGSFARSYGELSSIHDRMADNGIQFALSLHQMHEDLQELAAEKERKRKEWKQKGLGAEKRVQDAEGAMDKAKTKYNSLAEDYDRARTGDKQSGRFGLKGPRSAAQVEEDLSRKMQIADSDYASKVQNAQTLQQELISTLRPQAIRALEQLVSECDSGLTLQMQKFATFNEKLLLSNGLCISPVKGQDGFPPSQGRSLRDVVQDIDNDKDLKAYVSGFASKVTPRHIDARYEPHAPSQAPQSLPQQPTASQASPMNANRQATQATLSRSNLQPEGIPYPNGSHGSLQPEDTIPSYPGAQEEGSRFSEPYSPQQAHHHISNDPPLVHPSQQLPFSQEPEVQNQPPHPPYVQIPSINQASGTSANQAPPINQFGYSEPNGVPVKPVFGVGLDELFSRDGSAVPIVVHQCLQAVDVFGLDVEGIYRLSGNAAHINRLRSVFDHESSNVDFGNPENFFHDVNSVAGLLKQFFRDLPDPLLTREHYQDFIDAARIDDDIARRDNLHAAINNLPDPNYATLRALTLHLHRVQEHSHSNRMNAGNLAICFGPTLMVGGGIPAIADAGWQVRAIDTILQNAYSIFDED